ncbi:MAG: lytic transglycosylase domain-containing protein [Blastocatellia bacterium]|nr:lytic transglycosylase domain-containing protein [Blastocatellia bacterium]
MNQAFAKASNFKINAGSLDSYTTRYDNIIAGAVEGCPGLSPAVLKSLLAQESRFNPTVINQYGYAGIAQFGRPAAKEVGLYVGIAGSASDERLHPEKQSGSGTSA